MILKLKMANKFCRRRHAGGSGFSDDAMSYVSPTDIRDSRLPDSRVDSRDDFRGIDGLQDSTVTLINLIPDYYFRGIDGLQDSTVTLINALPDRGINDTKPNSD